MELLEIVETALLGHPQITERTMRIHSAVLGQSRALDAPNFTRIHVSDLETLFAEYDRAFFAGQVRASLGPANLRFKLSSRMTSSGGRTTIYCDRQTGNRSYEISVSTAMLFGCFRGDDHRPIIASGIECRDRLDALQRVFEHELIHLVEMLLWNESSCNQPRFHDVSRRLFGHTENRHKLITPRERTMVKFGIRPGMRVRFRFDGAELAGVVNRINKRATVLVEDARGDPYSDGKRYRKFYVPAQMLSVVDPAAGWLGLSPRSPSKAK